MRDILFKTDDAVFSLRAAGVVTENGCVLLQKPEDDPGYAFPGGHIAFGEVGEQTLVREFLEEINADVTVGELLWTGEIFFPWGNRPCHQICLYYRVRLTDDRTPRTGSFSGVEQTEGGKTELGFHWIPLDALDALPLYPPQCKDLLKNPPQGLSHFVYHEDA